MPHISRLRSRSASYSDSRRSISFHLSVGWPLPSNSASPAFSSIYDFSMQIRRFFLFHLVQRDLGHAERVAPRVRGHVDAARPGAAVVVQVFPVGHAEHRDRRVYLRFAHGGVYDRVLARHQSEFGVADRDRIDLARELGHFAGPQQADLLGAVERRDVRIAERGLDIHGRDDSRWPVRGRVSPVKFAPSVGT